MICFKVLRLNKKYVSVSIIVIMVVVSQSYFYFQLQSNHNKLQQDYSQLTSSYDALDVSYSLLQASYSSLEADYSSSQTQFSSLTSQINYLTGQVDVQYDLGYETGYTQGVIDGAGKGYTIRDPTYLEVLSFVAENQVDQNPYIVGSYICWNFVGDFKNDAFRAGYRCGYVHINFIDSAHAIVRFDTVDMGIIYIEPQNDEIVTLVVGQSYWIEQNIYPNPMMIL